LLFSIDISLGNLLSSLQSNQRKTFNIAYFTQKDQQIAKDVVKLPNILTLANELIGMVLSPFFVSKNKKILDSIAQDICNIKQTLSYSIIAATLFSNRAGHLLHKTNPNLSYFKLSNVFWEHNDSVGRETTVPNLLLQFFSIPIQYVR
jgi:hypothetical protein